MILKRIWTGNLGRKGDRRTESLEPAPLSADWGIMGLHLLYQLSLLSESESIIWTEEKALVSRRISAKLQPMVKTKQKTAISLERKNKKRFPRALLIYKAL